MCPWVESENSEILKLDKDNFIQQITEHGYFAEPFPDCFSSKKLAEHLDDLFSSDRCIEEQLKEGNNITSPTTLSIRKNDVHRRVLSLPNPKTFLCLAIIMQENWDEIQKYAESENSLSPITYLHKYKNNSDKIMLNSENVRDSISSKSSFVEGIRNCIQVSLGYKYRLKVDIANCYNTIYTHSISWAMCGKEKAKRYLKSKKPKDIKKKYELADKLDKYIRRQKDNESNGIIVGPFTSRIYSEIILAAIDRILAKEYVFRRYVDDYKFYFRTEASAKESISQIEKVLKEYGLHLNQSKTEISCFPFEIISDMQLTYQKALTDKGVFGVLNAASLLYSNGEKGAYKYALKFIKDQEPSPDDLNVIMSSLINILLVEPGYGKYVIKYFKNFISKWDRENIAKLINEELRVAIEDELEQEALIFLDIIKKLELPLNADNIINILKCSNDFAIVMALDIWENHEKFEIKNTDKADEINKGIEKLSHELTGEEFSGARWFLLYETRIHGLIPSEFTSTPLDDDFFKKLYEHRVTFYQSVSDNLY